MTSNPSDDEKNVVSVEELRDEPFNYDSIMENHIGELGKYQLHIFLWLFLPVSSSFIITMSYSFIGGVPDYRCWVDGCDSTNGTNEFTPVWLNNTIPWGDSFDKHLTQCYRYNHTWNNLDECISGDSSVSEKNVEKCDEWVYDTSVFDSTVFSEFEMTCDDEWKTTIPGMAYMVGMMFGALTCGMVADKIGRKTAYVFNLFLLTCVIVGSAFSPGIIMFSILRLFSGWFNIGQFEIPYVWGVESVGKKYRVTCGFIYQIVLTSGALLLGVVAYYIRDWKTLHLFIAGPLILCFAVYWIVPESTLWLISRKKFDTARKFILKASKKNGKNVPEYLLVVPPVSNNKGDENKPSVSKENDPTKKEVDSSPSVQESKDTLLRVFQTPVMLKRLLIVALTWVGTCLGYFGITFSANNLAGGYYLNYELIMLVEIPANIAGIYAVERGGRRITLSCGLIIGGIACLITGLVPEDPTYLRITFSMIGKFFVTAVFSALYVYTVELFPTGCRVAAMGFCSTCARAGSILAPYLADAGRRVNPSLPYIIFACINFLVGFLCLWLPETKGLPLPATMSEAIELEKYNITILRCCGTKNRAEDSENGDRSSTVADPNRKSTSTESILPKD